MHKAPGKRPCGLHAGARVHGRTKTSLEIVVRNASSFKNRSRSEANLAFVAKSPVMSRPVSCVATATVYSRPLQLEWVVYCESAATPGPRCEAFRIVSAFDSWFSESLCEKAVQENRAHSISMRGFRGVALTHQWFVAGVCGRINKFVEDSDEEYQLFPQVE